MDITTQYEPTVAEIRDTCTRNAAKGRRTWWFNAVIGIGAGTASLVMGAVADTDSGFTVLQILLGGFLVLFGAWHVLLLRLGVKGAVTSNAARLCGPTTLRLTGDRYSFDLPADKGEVLWELTRIVVSPDAWTFTVNNKISLIVPKRALPAQDQATFAAFVAGRNPKLVKIV